MRLIDADALKREMWRRCGETDIEIDKGRAKWDSGLWIRYKVFEECIADAPTIETEPKRGRWIYDGKGGYGLYKCSECNEFWSHWYADVIPIERMNKILKFCPNCGAIMDEVTE